MTPADALGARSYDPFCERGVLAAINQLADSSHSKAMGDLITEGKWKPELLITLGKVGPPRYANFIGRYKDDPDASVRHATAVALGLIDNALIAVPILIQLLARASDKEEDFGIRWEASESLASIAKRKSAAEPTRRRLAELLQERDRMTVALAARSLAMAGDSRGAAKLHDLTSDANPRVREEAVLALGESADKSARDLVVSRLKDESLAVRASAVYALGRIGGPAIIPTLRKAVEESTEYERELDRRRQRGESESALRDKHGLGSYDLRETLQQAIESAQKP